MQEFHSKLEKASLLTEVKIRTDLRQGDLEQVIQLHVMVYQQEYQYGSAFQNYVLRGLDEFQKQYDPESDCVGVCEFKDQMVGFLLLMHRPKRFAQLRFFILKPDFRGQGLGKKLIYLFMQFLNDRDYRGAYLWTTNEQFQAAALYTRYGFKLTEEKDSMAFGKSLKEELYVYLK